MASSRKSFLSRTSYIFPTTSETETNFNQKPSQGKELEFDEADVWNMSYSNSNTIIEPKKGVPGLKRVSRKMEANNKVNPLALASSSLPMNIPDWSKILKEEYKKKKESSDDEDEDEGVELPPHEYLARTRGASLSVHEGKGRTLKGRDLRSVRNAIWKKVGFED